MDKYELIERTKQFAHGCEKPALSLAGNYLGNHIEEADETEFWPGFIVDDELKPEHMIRPLKNEADELTSVFIASRRTIPLND